MKKAVFFLCLFFICFAFNTCAAPIAKIIKVKGEVYLKLDEKAGWQPAAVGLELKNESEIKTKPASECWIIFDKAGKNIIALKEKGLIKAEDIKAGKLILNQGRVVSLIDDPKVFKRSRRRFQVRTPSAVVGVRGTGWDTRLDADDTAASCFEGEVDISSLDAQGRESPAQTIPKGFGRRVSSGGVVGDSFELDDAAYELWNDFRKGVEGVGKIIGSVTKIVGGVTDGARAAYADEKTDNPFNR